MRVFSQGEKRVILQKDDGFTSLIHVGFLRARCE